MKQIAPNVRNDKSKNVFYIKNKFENNLQSKKCCYIKCQFRKKKRTTRLVQKRNIKNTTRRKFRCYQYRHRNHPLH
ncbi:hypothetical protein DERP_009524 [Dermatophagoides pteronyssinus]|uniref:Uncharacterized protein n=1 Tax=Dermatophagoides pteronyssinus TaxID=6956 RepID=A0ABQ8IV45_DERPT|nr:hypothetical protein DERP_009524 [Dermatophagoides pteronyssinus]